MYLIVTNYFHLLFFQHFFFFLMITYVIIFQLPFSYPYDQVSFPLGQNLLISRKKKKKKQPAKQQKVSCSFYKFGNSLSCVFSFHNSLYFFSGFFFLDTNFKQEIKWIYKCSSFNFCFGFLFLLLPKSALHFHTAMK